MRKLSLLLTLTLLTFGAFAQTVVNISGTLSSNNSTPLGNIPVIIQADSIGSFNYVDTLYTNANGYYSTTVTVPAGNSQGGFSARITDCYQANKYAYAWFSPQSTNLVMNFVYCNSVPCNAYFYSYPDSNTLFGMSFVNQSTGSSNLSYSWDFGDGNSSSTMSPSHSYSAPGNYIVCLTVSDSSCSSTYCDTVVVDTLQQQPNCNAWFYWNPDTLNNLKIDFSNSSSASSTATYSWIFGDNNTSSAVSPSHTYASAGIYNVCLIVTDGSCTDTVCRSVRVDTVIAPPPCNASFTWVDSSNTGWIHFDTFNSTASQNALFTWDFGDGTTGTGRYPIHQYTNSGTYIACLTVVSGNCTSTFCDSVVVGTISNSHTVSGNIYKDTLGTPALQARVYLIEADSTPNGTTLTAVDSVVVQQGSYTFSNVASGTYYIKAALLPASNDYNSYLPTYYGHQLFWSNASSIYVNGNRTGRNITLIAGNNLGGPGFIGGLVSQGANKKAGPGDPVVGASVLLLNNADEPVSHTETDASGRYGFNNLALSTYRVYVEIPGKESRAFVVTLSENSQSFNEANFAVNKAQVTGIADLTNVTIAGMSPNPAVNELNLSFTVKRATEMHISIVSITGQEQLVYDVNALQGEQQVSLDISNLKPGVYLVKVNAEGEQMIQKLIKSDL